MSFKSSQGVNLGDGKFDDSGSIMMDYGPMGTIWQWRPDADNGAGAWKLMTQFRLQSWRWNFNNHFEFGISSQHGRALSSLGNDVEYFVTVGGLI